MMNIWCISKYASIPKYGAAARLFYLCKEFSKLDNNVVLFTSDSNHLCEYPKTNSRFNYEDIEGVNVCWIKNIKYKKTASVKRVLSWFDFELQLFMSDREKFDKPDVVLVSSLSLLSIFYGYYLKLKYGSFLIFEIRDIWPLTLIEEGDFSKYHPFSLFLGLIEKFGYRKADLIVGTMPRLNIHVEKILGYEKDVFCSPLGFDDLQMSNMSNQNSFKNFFPANKKIVGYAGSMGISNSLQTFIDVIKKMSKIQDVHFVLVGDGDLKGNFIKQLKNYPNVTFVPKIKQEEVQSFLNFCDVLYLSTQNSKVWMYGQSMNKVVQYMLSGKPIVASYSGYPSMINEAGSGVFVPVGDSEKLQKEFIRLLNLTKVENQKLGLKGRDWIISNRSYKKLARQYLSKIVQML